MTSLDPLLAHGCRELSWVHDPESGLSAAVAVHHLHGGVAFGGLRRRVFASPAEAEAEVLGLARAMGRKCALAGVPGGGAKGVILDHPDLDRPVAYRALGRWIEARGGSFRTGPDVGTGDAELAELAASTRYVAAPGPDGPPDLAGATVAGVLGGLGALFLEGDGEPRFEGRRVVIQGLGKVGLRLAEELAARGVELAATDLDPGRVEAAEALGVRPLAPGEELDARADVFAPCALGGLLDPALAARLPVGAVCGGANETLAAGREQETARAFTARGIRVVPDFAASAGAVLRGAQHALGHALASLQEIEGTNRARCADILLRAGEEDRTPLEVALERAQEALLTRRRESAEALRVRNEPSLQLQRP